ncbi:MAG: TolC family protein [Sulfuricurvum sp.]|uniref:TolC family protein n=1 Tax=Sulfuricurvum sp. TaxID=2025608 RepID=UPI0025E0A42E|nr:TolC family protein [Sulfuricurvum sp.]MCK9371835.1 TolC family protein [Sulfuricurvum sp.]
MKQSWVCGVLMIPLLSSAMSFQAASEQAYGASGEMIRLSGKVQSNGYERDAVLSAEPLSLEGSARRIRADDARGEGIEYGMMVGFSMKPAGIKHAQQRQYAVRSKTFQYEQLQQQGWIQVSLKRDWLLFLLSGERMKILADKVEVSEKGYAMGSKKFQAGRMSQMELLRLDTERQNASREYALAAMESEHAQLRLQEITMNKGALVIDDLAFSFIRDDNGTENRIDNAAVLGVFRGREEELNAEIDLLRRSRVERINLGVGMTQEPTQNSLDMKLTVPLVWNDRNEKKIAALMSERSALIAQREALKDKLRLRTYGALEHLAEREKRIKELRNNEKSYETLFHMAYKGFEGGVVPQFEYLAAKNAFYDARLRSVGLKNDYVEEMSTLEEKLGGVWK